MTEPLNDDDNDDDDDDSTLRISNKYFSAHVRLQDIGSAMFTDDTKEDGVILVFDALVSNPDRPTTHDQLSFGVTFDSLPMAHEKTESMDGAGDLLRLCVGVTLTPPSSPQDLRGQKADAEYSRRILWCLDRGYEYVEADLSADGLLKGHGDRDKEGFARIVEAIQGTVWSSAIMMKMSSSTTPHHTLGSQQQQQYHHQDDQREEKTASIMGEEEEQEEKENPYEPPDPLILGTAFATMATPVGGAQSPPSLATAADDISDIILDPDSVVGGPAERMAEMAELKKDLEADQLFEQMEGVVREAARIREASKSGTMTDEERRHRAGDAAMALVNLLTQFGLDDDDDDDNIDDDDDDDSGIAIADGHE